MKIFGRRSEAPKPPKHTDDPVRLKMTTALRSRMYEEGQYAQYGLKKRKICVTRKGE